MSFYFFGDSICFGQYVSHHLTWVSTVARSLDEIAGAHSLPLITQVAAINGETSHQAIDRLDHAVVSHRPTFVWVQFGLNDANYWETDKGMPRVSVDRFIANVSGIVERILRLTDAQLFVANNHTVTKEARGFPAGTYVENVRKYNDKLREHFHRQRQSRISFVDVEQNLLLTKAPPETLLLADGVHLNGEGHRAYSQMALLHICPVVESKLQEFVQ